MCISAQEKGKKAKLYEFLSNDYMKIISLNCGEIIKREENLSSCRFAEVTLRLRGRIPYEPEFFSHSCKSCEVFMIKLNNSQRFFLKKILA